MGWIAINNLHEGMNLRDADLVIAPGETGVSLGCDFSQPGVIKPMKSGKKVGATYSYSIVDAHIVYIGGTKYIFTTHSSGLYYTLTTPVLIDAAFTGVFKIAVVNEEYVVLMNSTLCKKWKPGWAATSTWGVATHPSIAAAAKTLETKTIDLCEATTGWSITGGGGGAAIATDAVNYREGTKSIKLTCDAGNTITAKKDITLDLTKIDANTDAGSAAYLRFYMYPYALGAIDSIKLKLSCETGKGFTKDFYEMKITLGGTELQTTLMVNRGEMLGVYDDPRESYRVAQLTTQTYQQPFQISPEAAKISGYDGESDPIFIAQLTAGLDGIDSVLSNAQQIVIDAKMRRTVVSNASWSEIKIPLTDFSRTGDTAGRDWNTITAIAIEVTAIGSQANVSFDQIELCGAGNLWGSYWVAAAYQNSLGNYGAYSSFAGPVYLEGQELSISGLSPGSDSQITKRRLAIIGGAMTSPMVTYVENNTDTSAEYNEPDGTLTQAEVFFNNHAPVAGNDLVLHNGRVFIAGPQTNPTRVIYSDPFMFEAFPYRNYMPVSGGEPVNQIGIMGEYLAVRSSAQEFIIHMLGDSHKSWRVLNGAIEGAASKRLLLNLGDGAQVYMSPKGLFISTNGGLKQYYLPKVNTVISDHANAKGGIAGDRAYIGFRDVSGNQRIMRIDYRLGKPVAHYVMNLSVAAIVSDPIDEKVYYAYGANLYEFDAAINALPVSLEIPGQSGGSAEIKDFVRLQYALDNGPLSMTLKTDRRTLSGSYTLPTAPDHGESKMLPKCSGRFLGLTLTSTGQDFALYLPLKIEMVAIGD